MSSYVYHNTMRFLINKMIYDEKICQDFEIAHQNEYDYFPSSVYLRRLYEKLEAKWVIVSCYVWF